jgi:hypothetical protein
MHLYSGTNLMKVGTHEKEAVNTERMFVKRLCFALCILFASASLAKAAQLVPAENTTIDSTAIIRMNAYVEAALNPMKGNPAAADEKISSQFQLDLKATLEKKLKSDGLDGDGDLEDPPGAIEENYRPYTPGDLSKGIVTFEYSQSFFGPKRSYAGGMGQLRSVLTTHGYGYIYYDESGGFHVTEAFITDVQVHTSLQIEKGSMSSAGGR